MFRMPRIWILRTSFDPIDTFLKCFKLRLNKLAIRNTPFNQILLGTQILKKNEKNNTLEI